MENGEFEIGYLLPGRKISVKEKKIQFFKGGEKTVANNYIWDLDGTLLDSYKIIVDALDLVCRKAGHPVEKNEINRFIIAESVGKFLESMRDAYGLDMEWMRAEYRAYSNAHKDQIEPMKHAREILLCLLARGDRLFVYTHRGPTTEFILKNVGFDVLFEDVITVENGFPLKPAPDALLYLMGKYNLSSENTYYVGDRIIDMECAKSAGVAGILLLPEGGFGIHNGSETYIVKDLMEIADLPVGKR